MEKQYNILYWTPIQLWQLVADLAREMSEEVNLSQMNVRIKFGVIEGTPNGYRQAVTIRFE